MKIGELCNRTVIVASAEDSIVEVAQQMREHHVGCVVIARGEPGQRLPIGIITDRDIALQVVAALRDPAKTTAAAIMSTELYSAQEGQDSHDVLLQMRARGLRRVPVVDEKGLLQGILTFDDIVEWSSEQIQDLTSVVQREMQRERKRSGSI